MKPVKEFELLRHFLHDKENVAIAQNIASAPDLQLLFPASSSSSSPQRTKSMTFLKSLAGHFGDLQKALPSASYSGVMDFACQLDDGTFALVEMQVIPHNNWDNRALYYLASFYGSQLRQGSSWDQVQKVIAINILGGGVREQAHWRSTPHQFQRHYKFQEQLDKESPARYIEGIELFQYSVMNVPDSPSLNRETRDWLTFFKNAARMDEEGVNQLIETPAVKKAFQMATLSTLTPDVSTKYHDEDASYQRFSQFTAEQFCEGEAKGRAEGEAKGRAEGEAKARLQAARKLKNTGKVTDEFIVALLELTETEVSEMNLAE